MIKQAIQTTIQSLPEVAEGHVDAMLKRNSRSSWSELQKDRPAIAAFIMAASYEIAPDDPQLRGQISEALLNLCVLLGESQTHQELLQTLGKSLDKYFPSPQ
jgi:hypothetical protein